jgi:hypothetical protein
MAQWRADRKDYPILQQSPPVVQSPSAATPADSSLDGNFHGSVVDGSQRAFLYPCYVAVADYLRFYSWAIAATKTMPHHLLTAVFLAGIGQIALALASLAIPRVLRWREDTARLRPLTRQVFWTYAGYIWATNLSFGLVSLLLPGSLIDRSPLAAAVTAFIAAYWLARLVIQFTWFDRSDAPAGWHVRAAEVALVSLFVLLTATYIAAGLFNLGWIGT